MDTNYDYTVIPPYVMDIVNDNVNNVVTAHQTAIDDILQVEECLYCE